MPKNAIVVGMARSGTSLTTAIFARRGYYLGTSTLPYKQEGDDHNPFGYFEADNLVNTNIEILRQVAHPEIETCCATPISPESIRRIEEMPPQPEHRQLVESYEQNSPWVWKDTRLCYTLPYWWQFMDPERTRVLLVRRNPLETYRSFVRLGWCEATDEARAAVAQRAGEHNAAVLATVTRLNIPYTTVDYHEYHETPDQVVRRLGEFFEMELSVEDLNFRRELNHNTLRGQIATQLRNQIKKLPRRPVRQLERLIPRSVLALVFPERKYTDDHAAKSRENGR